MKLNKKTIMIGLAIILIALIVIIYLRIRSKNKKIKQDSDNINIPENSEKVVGKTGIALKDKEANLFSKPDNNSEKIGTIKPTKTIGVVEDVVVGSKDELLYYVFTIEKNSEKVKVFVREDNLDLK